MDSLDFLANRYGTTPLTIWQTWTPRQVEALMPIARRARWMEDDLMIMYGGGGYERTAPDWGRGGEGVAAGAAGGRSSREEVEEQRRLQALNKDRIDAVKAKARAGRMAGGKGAYDPTYGSFGADMTNLKTVKILRDD